MMMAPYDQKRGQFNGMVLNAADTTSYEDLHRESHALDAAEDLVINPNWFKAEVYLDGVVPPRKALQSDTIRQPTTQSATRYAPQPILQSDPQSTSQPLQQAPDTQSRATPAHQLTHTPAYTCDQSQTTQTV
ncbi:hypothetical protein PSPO01_07605 [Paraphaeosphaeria sporulosa]